MSQSHQVYHQIASDTYVPRPARITEVCDITSREKFYRLELDKPLGHRPGQFVMLSVFGVGEAPISISIGPTQEPILELVIRKAGRLTQVLHDLEVGQMVGIRGPFGNGFDLADFYGKDVLFVAGGLGLAPLRSLISPVVDQISRFGTVTILSGSRNPAEELFRDQLKEWAATSGVHVIRLVNSTENMPWKFEVGLVTQPIPALDLDPAKTVAALCGPPVMYKFVIMALSAKQIGHDQIFIDLERRMRCGVGKCGHCQINHYYCCQQGPVFRFSQMADLPEALL